MVQCAIALSLASTLLQIATALCAEEFQEPPSFLGWLFQCPVLNIQKGSLKN